MFCVCHVILSFHCSLVVNCWERVDLLARLFVKFSLVFVTFPCDVLGQVWYLIVSIPELCLLAYFDSNAIGPIQNFHCHLHTRIQDYSNTISFKQSKCWLMIVLCIEI